MNPLEAWYRKVATAEEEIARLEAENARLKARAEEAEKKIQAAADALGTCGLDTCPGWDS